MDTAASSPSVYQQRKEIMEFAAELQAFKREVLDHLRPIDALISKLIAAGDQMIPRAADEVEAGETRTVRRMRYRAGEGDEPTGSAPKPNAAPETGVERIAARIAREMAPKARRRMRPLTEAEKERRRESLKKARAAKGRK